MRETASADGRLQQFVRVLYFDLQRIDGVKPLEVWNGVREFFDPYEKANLVKNLYKIALPLVNEACFGRPFEEHASTVRAAVEGTVAWFVDSPASRLFERFPDPPTGEGAEKEIYGLVREQLRQRVRETAGDAPPLPPPGRPVDAIFPDGLFDFREMRIVDNEMPYLIFTDKEFRVIHGLAVVYLWLIDLDGIYCATLESLGADPALIEEYRKFVVKVHRESPLTIKGRKMDTRELSAHIHDKLKYEDYLDIFENVYRWFESTRDKLGAR
ncbi:MAG: hypothetical protein NTU62_15915 [Spirochaetes bacterium]|nr:hypothetical protein [Spirochaetota bacterium]